MKSTGALGVGAALEEEEETGLDFNEVEWEEEEGSGFECFSEEEDLEEEEEGFAAEDGVFCFPLVDTDDCLLVGTRSVGFESSLRDSDLCCPI